jgi:hypothetical protein
MRGPEGDGAASRHAAAARPAGATQLQVVGNSGRATMAAPTRQAREAAPSSQTHIASRSRAEGNSDLVDVTDDTKVGT